MSSWLYQILLVLKPGYWSTAKYQIPSTKLQWNPKFQYWSSLQQAAGNLRNVRYLYHIYCSSLANPAARLVDELKSSRYGECARWSIFNDKNRFVILNFGHCDLFGICDLLFGIFIHSNTQVLQCYILSKAVQFSPRQKNSGLRMNE